METIGRFRSSTIRPGPPKCYTKLSVHKNKDKKWTATKQCGGNKSFAYRLGWTPHNCWEAVMLTLQQWLQILSRKQFSGKLGLPSTLDTLTREKHLKYFCWCPCPAWLDLQGRQPTTTGIVANITGISVANSQSTAWNSYAYGKIMIWGESREHRGKYNKYKQNKRKEETCENVGGIKLSRSAGKRKTRRIDFVEWLCRIEPKYRCMRERKKTNRERK